MECHIWAFYVRYFKMPGWVTSPLVASHVSSLNCLDSPKLQLQCSFFLSLSNLEFSLSSSSLYRKCVKRIKKMLTAANVNEHINFAASFLFLPFFLVGSKFSMPGLSTAESAVPRSRSVF